MQSDVFPKLTQKLSERRNDLCHLYVEHFVTKSHKIIKKPQNLWDRYGDAIQLQKQKLLLGNNQSVSITLQSQIRTTHCCDFFRPISTEKMKSHEENSCSMNYAGRSNASNEQKKKKNKLKSTTA